MTTAQARALYTVMETFDFNTVQTYMKLADWKWAGIGVPTVDDLKSTAESLLRLVLKANDPNHGYTATGGFSARLDGWSKTGQPTLRLSFSIVTKEATINS